MPFTLVSHALCPYVQRAAILLAEKNLAFSRRYVDLSDKPDWFLEVSPLGKTPVLLVDREALFESAVICEYIDEVHPPRLHPEDPLERARHRAWVEFASAVLSTIGAFYSAPDEVSLQQKANELAAMLRRVEAQLGDGPFFAGHAFCLVDAAFAPVFRYFDLFDGMGDFRRITDLPRIAAWRAQLARRQSVRQAVAAGYPEQLRRFVRQRGSALSALLTA